MIVTKIDADGFYLSHREINKYDTWGDDELHGVMPPIMTDRKYYKYVNGGWEEYASKPIEVPQTITDLQAWQVLAQIGKLDAVKAMAEADVLFGIWFDRALVWERTNQYVISAGVTLGLTDAEIDDLFILGATL